MKIPALGLGALILGACNGYQLGLSGPSAGVGEPSALRGARISIEGVAPYEDFHQRLRDSLHGYGAGVVSSRRAQRRIQVKEFKVRERALTRGDDAKTRDIMLVVDLRFAVERRDSQGQWRAAKPHRLQARRLYEYNDLRRLVGERERQRVAAALQGEIIEQLVRLLDEAPPRAP